MSQGTVAPGRLPGIFDIWTGRARTCISCVSGVQSWFSAQNHLLLDLAVALALFFALLCFPTFVASQQLDPSWSQSLGAFLKTHAQAGTDYVFTYGPLGYFSTRAYDPDLWWYSYAWAVVFSAILSLLTILTGRRIAAIDVRVLFYGVYFYFITFMDVRWMLAALELTFLLMVHRPRFPVLCCAMLFLATMSLLKFTILVYTSIGVGLLTFGWFLETRHARAVVPLLLYVGAFFGLWMALGQGISSFPAYVRNSLEITRGYTAMGYGVLNPTFKVSLWILAINALFCVMVLRQKPFKLGPAAFALYSIFCLLTSWKHGFVRDDSHVLLFFQFALGLPFVLMAYDAAFMKSAMVRALLGVSLLLSLHGWYCTNQTHFSPSNMMRESGHRILASVVDCMLPWHTKAKLDTAYAHAIEDWELPEIKRVVGQGTVDVVSHGQGVVLLNRLNWTPRPVFQSYTAYTESLLRMNTRFFHGDQTPQFVLFRSEPIDGRFPMLEDSGVILELLRCYKPVLAEKKYLLMHHSVERKNGADTEPVRNVERTIELGEEVAMTAASGEYLTLALKFHESAAGQLLRSLYRPPVVLLKVETASGVQNEYRLIPEITESPFLLSPLVQDQADFANLYSQILPEHIVKFSITAKKLWGVDCYDSQIQMKLAAFRLPAEDSLLWLSSDKQELLSKKSP
jgi:hypothetical protein